MGAVFKPAPYLKMKRIVLIGILLVILVAAETGFATEYYVDSNGNDLNTGLSWEQAFRTIQKAITSSTTQGDANEPNTWDIIYVNSGTYVTKPIIINNDSIWLKFKNGVNVLAKSNSVSNDPNQFLPDGTMLFKAIRRRNINFEGNNTIFRMNKSEYIGLGGTARLCIGLYGCQNVKISNLIIQDAGGSGIGINYSQGGCKDILVNNVVIDNAYTNAISVISVDGLIIEKCTLKNSNGSPPEAGIDFEPNNDYNKLKNIVVRDTTIKNPSGAGIDILTGNLNSTSDNIDLYLKDVNITGGKYGIRVLNESYGVKGSIVFDNIVIEKAGYTVIGKACQVPKLTFKDCIWTSINDDAQHSSPIIIWPPSDNNNTGGITFNNCQVFDGINRPAIRFGGSDKLYELHGDLYLYNPNRIGNPYDWHGAKLYNVDINVSRR